MTSLVDVIFLLLLFFMLTSTFSRFAEVELFAAAGGDGGASPAPIFLQLFPDRLTVNGTPRTLEALALTPEEGRTVLVALKEGVDAQRLTDLLVALRAYPGLGVSILGAG